MKDYRKALETATKISLGIAMAGTAIYLIARYLTKNLDYNMSFESLSDSKQEENKNSANMLEIFKDNKSEGGEIYEISHHELALMALNSRGAYN